MKKGVTLLIALFLILTACAPSQVIQVQQPRPTEQTTAPGAVINVAAVPLFKLIQDFGVRSPPSIGGTVKNVGNATGTVKVTARVYYAKVISSERSQVIENLKPGDEAKFSIPIDKTVQWTSYQVVLEKQ